jgi:hypothetical protein
MELVANDASVEALLEEMPDASVLGIELLRIGTLQATHPH